LLVDQPHKPEIQSGFPLGMVVVARTGESQKPALTLNRDIGV
jgi:hypothetical protein